MAFDAFPLASDKIAPLSLGALIDAASAPSADVASANPDRALAMLFVAPRDCMAVDVLASL